MECLILWISVIDRRGGWYVQFYFITTCEGLLRDFITASYIYTNIVSSEIQFYGKISESKKYNIIPLGEQCTCMRFDSRSSGALWTCACHSTWPVYKLGHFNSSLTSIYYHIYIYIFPYIIWTHFVVNNTQIDTLKLLLSLQINYK